MRIALFYHSLVSDWNHGNAHFLRGVTRELIERGHTVNVFEPADGWSCTRLAEDAGVDAVHAYREAYPELESKLYDAATFNFDEAAATHDLIIVHEWNDPAVVAAVGKAVARRRDPNCAQRRSRRDRGYDDAQASRLFFHDTHHRSVTQPEQISAYDLSAYDGVLAFGRVIRDRYLAEGWARRAWTWHEAADVSVFHPMSGLIEGDVVWIGNWGDDERSEEIREFLIEPVNRLKLRATVYGVRYPKAARKLLADHNIQYGGYLPNHRVPEVFSRHRVTMHIPRRPYAEALPGIPTIRPFEALACGIPLLSAPWSDDEGLFRPGDFLPVRNGEAMTGALKRMTRSAAMRQHMAKRGLETIREHHTCRHRVDELMTICHELGMPPDLLEGGHEAELVRHRPALAGY